ncbi:MAG: biotin--[acetyl-CoA-carboxylase] ligase [Draconibacterium sp.]|nr:MAG: biotin--[acetyl-CoA-carboxylase] ligase [Draconibacterium sp.]
MRQEHKNIVRLKEVNSTNNYAYRLIMTDSAADGTVVLAQYQTQGKGQQGAFWESDPGKNLLMSTIWFPSLLPAEQQFTISKAVSLAITDFLLSETDEVTIKWPNDIYIGNQKIAGILIENAVKGAYLHSSVIGIGLNLNQTKFISDAPNPVSLKQITGLNYNIDEVLNQLLTLLDSWLGKISKDETETIDKQYLSRLFRFGKWAKFIEPGNNSFEAKIIGIGNFGQLQLQLKDNSVKEYLFREVQYAIK